MIPVTHDPQAASEFRGQTVLVTGAASGIGAALAQALLSAGARVIALDQNATGLEALRAAHVQADAPADAGLRADTGFHAEAGSDAEAGPHAYASPRADTPLTTIAVDVSESAAVNAAVAQGEAEQGPIQKLATVAGILQMGQVVNLSDDAWSRTLAVNTTGTFNVLRAVGARMVERGQGAVVVVSSNAATTPRTGMGAYAASKAAVTQLARCFALEVAQAGIRCNIVSPGSTDTEMQRAMWRQGSSAQTVIEGSAPAFRLGIPLRKIAQPTDIVESILFLLSDRAGHITLHDLRVDGGATLDS